MYLVGKLELRYKLMLILVRTVYIEKYLVKYTTTGISKFLSIWTHPFCKLRYINVHTE